MAAMDQIAAWLERHVNPSAVLITIAILLAAGIVILLLNRLFKAWLGGLAARFGLHHRTVATITRVFTSALWIFTALLILDIWGIGLGGVWTLVVSAATVIGVGFLATWTMISNITASVLLTFWRPYHLGDDVELLPENLKGQVIDRNLMFTVLREEGGAAILIPNNLFFQKMFRVKRGSG
jgi:small-conductance mechanosensitive channel